MLFFLQNVWTCKFVNYLHYHRLHAVKMRSPVKFNLPCNCLLSSVRVTRHSWRWLFYLLKECVIKDSAINCFKGRSSCLDSYSACILGTCYDTYKIPVPSFAVSVCLFHHWERTRSRLLLYFTLHLPYSLPSKDLTTHQSPTPAREMLCKCSLGLWKVARRGSIFEQNPHSLHALVLF